MRTRKLLRAFSLLETLSVVAIGAVLLMLAARSSLPSNDHLAPVMAAREFNSLLREARLLAMEQRAPTRLVFVPRSLSMREEAVGEDPYVECVLFRFVIPAAGERTVAWRSPAAENSLRGGDALERLPVTPPGLPAELVGQWQRVPHKPFRFGEMLQRRLLVQSELLDRFARQSPEEFATENSFRPLAFWEAGESVPWDGFCHTSPYPSNYHRTPFPEGPQLRDEPLPSAARVFDAQAARWQSAAVYWSDSAPVPHFSTTQLATVAFQDLPFLEFDAQGRLQIAWAGEHEVVFQVKGRPEFTSRVQLGGTDNPARLARHQP
jgi:hypothetical protein